MNEWTRAHKDCLAALALLDIPCATEERQEFQKCFCLSGPQSKAVDGCDRECLSERVIQLLDALPRQQNPKVMCDLA